MRVLGIDCGSERTGYGVIDSDGLHHRMVAAGVIKTDPKWPFEQPAARDRERLAPIDRRALARVRGGGRKYSFRPT